MPVPNTSKRVLCAGILVTDIFVPPLPTLPAAGELRATDDFLMETGGCAANVAVGLARLGVRSSVSGVVGVDVLGDFLIKKLQDKGIDTSGIRCTSEYGTSKTVVLPVIGEDRRFIHTVGANNAFTESDIVFDNLNSGDVLYIGGLLIMPALKSEGVARICETARSRGITTVLDVVVPAGDDSASRYVEYLRPVLKHADIFMPNEEEAFALTGETDVEAQADFFLSAGCETVIITRGAKGTLLKTRDRSLYAGAFPIDFVDGSGAGDAFAAGLIAGLTEGWEMKRSLAFAGAVGASACTALGCTPSVVDREGAEAMMAAHTPEMVEKKG